MLEASDDIEADIRAALSGESGDPPTAAAPVAAAVEGDPPPEPVADGTQRDEKGRFATKGENKPLDANGEATQAPNAAPVQQPEPSEAIRPPQSWSAKAKAQFAALDPVIQAEVLKREKDVDAGLAQWRPKGERLNRLDTVIDPIRDRLTLAGIDEVAYLQALTKADEMLRGPDKLNALLQVAQMYGIALPSGQQAFAPQPYPQAMQQAPDDPRIQSLSQKLSELEGYLSHQNETRTQQERAQLEGEVETFRKGNIYFDNVRERMATLLSSGQAADLADAYDQACWSDKEIRQLLASPPTAPKPATAQARGAPAGLSTTGSPGLTAKVKSNNPSSDIEDDVRGALQEVMGRL